MFEEGPDIVYGVYGTGAAVVFLLVFPTSDEAEYG